MNPTPADLERLDNELSSPPMQIVHIPPDPMVMVAAAIEKGMDPQKILDFIDRVNATKAAEVFAQAVAKFQAECPQILKDRPVKNRSGETMYSFASYDDVNKAVAPLLKECGIVVTFDIDPEVKNNLMTGTCRIRVGSHSECTRMPIPISKGMNTSASQDFGGTLTYLKRYLFCAALNIIVTDELESDRDGSDGFITPEQVAEVNAALERCKDAGQPVTLGKFLAWVGATAKMTVESIDKMPTRTLDLALNFLASKAKGGAK